MAQHRSHDMFIDARTDQRWVDSVASLTAEKDFTKLWRLGLTAPPIWTIRIVKFLARHDWAPEQDEQPDLFHTLSKHAAACNEFDLPGPELRASTTTKLENIGRRVYAAKITTDGELLFLLDEKCTAIDIRRLLDLSEVARIRLDMIAGKVYAPLAFAITDSGDHLAVLLKESKTGDLKIHLYELDFGEIVSERWLKFETEFICDQVPKISISNDAETICIQLGENVVSMIRLAERKEQQPSCDFDLESAYVPVPYGVSNQNGFVDWQNYGKHGLKDPSAQHLSIKAGRLSIPGHSEFTILRDLQGGDNVRRVLTDSGAFAFSDCGRYFATIHDACVCVHNLTIDARECDASAPSTVKYALRQNQDLISLGFDTEQAKKQAVVGMSYCPDPVTRLAISTDSEFIAVAMSHTERILIHHLPEGRTMGLLHNLTRDVLVELKFTLAGSVVAVSRSGLVQIWEADGNGVAWPWSKELVSITHYPVSVSSVTVLRHAQEMRRRGWLSIQESNMLDIALLLMQNRLNLDIEIDFESELPGDIYDIEIDE